MDGNYESFQVKPELAEPKCEDEAASPTSLKMAHAISDVHRSADSAELSIPVATMAVPGGAMTSMDSSMKRSPTAMAASSWALGSGAEGDQTPGSKKLTALAAGGMSNFIKVKRQEDWQRESSRWRRKAGQIVSSPYVSNFMALVVIIDSYCTCADIDARAVLNGPGPPLWVTRLSEVCLLLYTVEVVLLLLLKGFSLLKKDTLMLVDVVIIVCGYTEWIMAILFNNQVEELGVLRTLRFLRIIRLLRLLRKIHGLRELQKLVIMMATCLKTLAWSFLFCFVIMTVWAMLIVEMVNPLIRDLGQRDDSPFQDCPDCMVATSSVMDANLLLFKTVIAGDSWGQIAVPVMREHPATGVIFVGSLLTIVFGVLNLIVAVVVDTFAEARERDVLNLAEEMERNHENDKKFLQKVFERIDEDGSGELTLEELVEGARKDPEFQSRLRVMDIDEVDLQQLFEMIDVDGSGSIEAAEFIAPLSRWVHDSKTAPRFIKYNMLRSMQQQEDIYRQSFNQFTALSTRMDELTESIQSLTIPSRPLVSAADFLLPREEEAARRTSEQLSERTESLDEVAVAEDVAEEHLDGPEQPQASKPADWRGPRVPRSRLGSDDQGGAADAAALAAAFQSNSHMLKAAVESLEKSLVSATEHALKKSMAMLEYAIHEEISNVEGRAPASRRASDLARDVFRAAPSRPGSGRPEEAPVFITRRASGEGWSAPKETGTDSKTGTESKDTKDTPPQGMGKEDPGEHIKRRGRRIATTELAGAPSLHYSRKAARHSLANAQFQFSGRI